MKTLKITEKAHKELNKIKIATGNKTLSDTIEIIAEWWNWWSKPGNVRKENKKYGSK